MHQGWIGGHGCVCARACVCKGTFTQTYILREPKRWFLFKRKTRGLRRKG